MRKLAVAGAAALGVVLTVAASANGATNAPSGARVSRVLVISLPNVEWSDIQGGTLPNLDRLFAASSIGGLVTNGIERPSPIESSYLTLGAGTRATAGGQSAGQGFGVDEEFGRDRAGRVFATRTGTSPGKGLVYMPIPDVVDANESELYGAEVGLLGDELQLAGIGRAVIANGDGSDPSTPEVREPPYRRSAVTALVTHDGKVPRGRVDRGLLQADASAPFGVRFDPDAVLDAFRAAWSDRSVVVVEGSDLVRADLAGRFASDEQRDRLRARALRDTDRLVGRLLDEVDAKRDAVIVVGPAPPRERPSLTPVSVRATGFTPGFLRSTTTRHDGFVNMVDVAPTILHLYGLDRPETMEGRRMESADTGSVPERRSGDALAGRVSFLVDTNDDGLFRDSQVGPSMTTVLVISCVLGVGVALVDLLSVRARSGLSVRARSGLSVRARSRLSVRARSGLRREKWLRRTAWPLVFLALALIGFLDATYLAGPLHFGRHGGAAPYWLFVVAVAVLLAIAFLTVAHLLSVRARSRNLVHAVLVALGSIVVLHVVDLVTGAHLEWNTVFGYSPTIGIRFVGEGNIAFAQLAAAAVLFAGLLVWQVPTRLTKRVAVGVLAVTIVVMGVPIWGNDFGAVLSALPGFALLAWMLLGHEVRARTVAAISGIVVTAVVAVGLLDLLRPADQRTHVGRFFQKVGTDLDGATLVIRRKAAANLSVFGHSVLLGTIIVVVLLVAYLWFVAPRSLRPVVRELSTANATGIAFLVVAVLGFALNDSGIAIPGMMFAVFESTLVVLMASSYFGALVKADEP
ncbi:MAG: hypothetical protein WD271_02650 [Acidimicrobiia bacterium]